MDIIETFKIRIWNMDKIENEKIKITKVSRLPVSNPFNSIQKRDIPHISPLKNKVKNISNFLCMDIETISILIILKYLY